MKFNVCYIYSSVRSLFSLSLGDDDSPLHDGGVIATSGEEVVILGREADFGHV